MDRARMLAPYPERRTYTMTSTTKQVPLSAGASAVENRLARWRLQPHTAVALVGVLVVLISDAQSLTLVPLVPTMQADYNLDAAQASWVLSTLSIVAAAAVPLLTRLGDRYGMRKLVLISLVTGMVGNALCALAPGFEMLIAGRVVMGLGAAFPLTFAILRERSTDVATTNRGSGALTAAIGLGLVLSYLLGGFIIELQGNVQTVFWVMTILAAISLVGAWILLPDSKTRDVAPIDYVGGVLLAFGLAAIVLAVNQGNALGWASGAITGLVITGVVLLTAWAVVEFRLKHPLINLRVTLLRTAWPAYVIVGLSAGVGVLQNLTVITYVQIPPEAGYGLGLSVLLSCLLLVPVAIIITFAGAIVAPFIKRFGARNTMMMGGAVSAAGFFWNVANHDEVWHYIVGGVVWGVGFSLAYGSANAAILHAAKPGEAAMFAATGSAVGASLNALFPALFTVILTAQFVGDTPLPDPGQFGWLWFFAGTIGVLIVIMAFVYRTPDYGLVAQAKEDAAAKR